MQMQPYVTQLQTQLAAAAALGDERTRDTANALAAAAEPAMRLAVLDAVSAGAEEITAALLDSPGSPAVAVRLDGDELRIDVRTGTGDDDEPSAARTDEGDASARISLRLSEALKSDVETAARRDSVSVNTWLVRAAAAALGAGRRGRGPGEQRDHQRSTHHDSQRITGWVNG